MKCAPQTPDVPVGCVLPALPGAFPRAAHALARALELGDFHGVAWWWMVTGMYGIDMSFWSGWYIFLVNHFKGEILLWMNGRLWRHWWQCTDFFSFRYVCLLILILNGDYNGSMLGIQPPIGDSEIWLVAGPRAIEDWHRKTAHLYMVYPQQWHCNSHVSFSYPPIPRHSKW